MPKYIVDEVKNKMTKIIFLGLDLISSISRKNMREEQNLYQKTLSVI
jgi:hypothetical protein